MRDRVFIWKDFKEWKPALEGMFPDILTRELEAKVRQQKPRVEDDEDSGPFEQVSGHSLDESITHDKISEFGLLYPHVRFYHACRPVNVQSYYEKGILFLRRDEQVERFKDIFLRSRRFPELTDDMLKQSIEAVDSLKKDAEAELCFVLDDRWIIEQCGHYLIYGSEYLSDLVSQLRPVGDVEPYRRELRRIGTPTMLKVNLPNTPDNVQNATIRGIIRDMLIEWVWCLSEGKAQSHVSWRDLARGRPLPPEHIRGHYTPARIPDPLNRPRVYITETGEYEDPN
jgi:hypothetical protein